MENTPTKMNKDQIALVPGIDGDVEFVVRIQEISGDIFLTRSNADLSSTISTSTSPFDSNSSTPSLFIYEDSTYITYRKETTNPDHKCDLVIARFKTDTLVEQWKTTFPIFKDFDALYPKLYVGGLTTKFVYLVYTDHNRKLINVRFSINLGEFERREVIRLSRALEFENYDPESLTVTCSKENVFFTMSASADLKDIRVVRYIRNLNVYTSNRLFDLQSALPKKNFRLLVDETNSKYYIHTDLITTPTPQLKLSAFPIGGDSNVSEWTSDNYYPLLGTPINGTIHHLSLFDNTALIAVVDSSGNSRTLKVSLGGGRIYGPLVKPLSGISLGGIVDTPQLAMQSPYDTIYLASTSLDRFTSPQSEVTIVPSNRLSRHQIAALNDFSRTFTVVKNTVSGNQSLVHTSADTLIEEISLGSGNRPSIDIRDSSQRFIFVTQFRFFETFSRYVIFQTRKYELSETTSTLSLVWSDELTFSEDDVEFLYPRITTTFSASSVIFKSSIDDRIRGFAYKNFGEEPILTVNGIIDDPSFVKNDPSYSDSDFQYLEDQIDVSRDQTDIYVTGISKSDSAVIKVFKVAGFDLKPLASYSTDLNLPSSPKSLPKISRNSLNKVFLQCLTGTDILVEHLTYSETNVAGIVEREYARDWTRNYGPRSFYGNTSLVNYYVDEFLVMIGRRNTGSSFFVFKVDDKENFYEDSSILFSGEDIPGRDLLGEIAIISQSPWETLVTAGSINGSGGTLGYNHVDSGISILTGPNSSTGTFEMGQEREPSTRATINISDHGRQNGDNVYLYFPFEINGVFELGASNEMSIEGVLLHNLEAGAKVIVQFTESGFTNGEYTVDRTETSTRFVIDYTGNGNEGDSGQLSYRNKINPKSDFYTVENRTDDSFEISGLESNGLRGFVSMSETVDTTGSGPFATTTTHPMVINIFSHGVEDNQIVYLFFGTGSPANNFYTATKINDDSFQIFYNNPDPLSGGTPTIFSGLYLKNPGEPNGYLEIRNHDLKQNDKLFVKFQGETDFSDVRLEKIRSEDEIEIAISPIPTTGPAQVKRAEPLTSSPIGYFTEKSGDPYTLVINFRTPHAFLENEEVYITFVKPRDGLTSQRFVTKNVTSQTFEIDIDNSLTITFPPDFNPESSDENDIYASKVLPFPYEGIEKTGSFINQFPLTEISIELPLSNVLGVGDTAYIKFVPNGIPAGFYTIDRIVEESVTKTLFITTFQDYDSSGTANLYTGEFNILAGSDIITIISRNHLRRVGDRLFVEFPNTPSLTGGVFVVETIIDEDSFRIRYGQTIPSSLSGEVNAEHLSILDNGNFVQGTPESKGGSIFVTSTNHGFLGRVGTTRGEMIRVTFTDTDLNDNVFEVMAVLDSNTFEILYEELDLKLTGNLIYRRVYYDSHDTDLNYLQWGEDVHLYDQLSRTSVFAYVSKYGYLGIRRIDQFGITYPGETLRLELINSQYELRECLDAMAFISCDKIRITTTDEPHRLNVDDVTLLKFEIDGEVTNQFFEQYRVVEIIDNFQFDVLNVNGISDGLGDVLLRKFRLLSNTLTNEDSYGRKPVLTREGDEIVMSYGVIKKALTSTVVIKSKKFDFNTFEQIWDSTREIVLEDINTEQLYLRSDIVSGEVYQILSRANGDIYAYNFPVKGGTLNPPRSLNISVDLSSCTLSEIQFINPGGDGSEGIVCYPCGNQIFVSRVDLFTGLKRFGFSTNFGESRTKSELVVRRIGKNAVLLYREEDGVNFYHRMSAFDIFKGVTRWSVDVTTEFPNLQNNSLTSFYSIGNKILLFGLVNGGTPQIKSMFLDSETGVKGTVIQTSDISDIPSSVIDFTVIPSELDAESLSVGYLTNVETEEGYSILDGNEINIRTFDKSEPNVQTVTTEVSEFQTSIQPKRTLETPRFVREDTILRVRTSNPPLENKRIGFKTEASGIRNGIVRVEGITNYGFNINYGEPTLPIDLFLVDYISATVNNTEQALIFIFKEGVEHPYSEGDKISLTFPPFYDLKDGVYEVFLVLSENVPLEASNGNIIENGIVIKYPDALKAEVGNDITIHTYANLPLENTAELVTNETDSLELVCNAKHGFEVGRVVYVNFPLGANLFDGFFEITSLVDEYSFTITYETETTSSTRIFGARIIDSLQCTLEEFDNVFSTGYFDRDSGASVVRYSEDGYTVERALDPLGESPCIHYDKVDETSIYSSYAKNVDTFARYICISVRKLDSVTLADKWSLDYVFEDTSVLSFRPRLRTTPFELVLEIARNDGTVGITTFDKITSDEISFLEVNPSLVVPSSNYLGLGLETGVRGDIYVSSPNTLDGIQIAKYKTSAVAQGTFSSNLTTITVTVTRHAFLVGQSLFMEFSSQSNIEPEIYTVSSVIDEDNFTVTSRFSLENFETLPVSVFYQSRTLTCSYSSPIGSPVINITSPYPHGLSDGDPVFVTFPGVLNLIDGDFNVTYVTDTEFRINYEVDPNISPGEGLLVKIYVTASEEWFTVQNGGGLSTGTKRSITVRESVDRELYLSYTENSSDKRLMKVSPEGVFEWSVNVGTPSYENKIHNLSMIGPYPVMFYMKVDGVNTASIIATKYDEEGVLLSELETNLQLFDQNVMYSSPSLNTRVYIDEDLDLANIFDEMWLVFPKPLNDPLLNNFAEYSNWEILVNKISVAEYGCPSEFLTTLKDDRFSLGLGDNLYVAYQTNNQVTTKTYISRIDEGGVTRALQTFEEGGQDPVLTTGFYGTYFCFPRRTCTFTDYVTLLSYRVNDQTLSKTWRRRRVFTDSLVEFFRPRVVVSETGMHLVYARQNGHVYIDTYRRSNGGVIIRSKKTSCVVTAELSEEISAQRVGNHICLAFPEISSPNIRVCKFSSEDLSEIYSISLDGGYSGPKRSLIAKSSEGDRYTPGENLYLGYVDTSSSDILVSKIDDAGIVLWTTSGGTIQRIANGRLHGMRVFGEFPVLFGINNTGTNLAVESFKWSSEGNYLETVVVDTEIPASNMASTINRGTATSPEIISINPFFLSRSPWDRGFIHFYTNASIPYGEEVSPYDRLIIGGLRAPISYQITVPKSEISEFQYEVSSTHFTFVAYTVDNVGSQTGVYLAKIDSNGDLVGSPVLVDEHGQSPTLTIYGSRIYVGYIRYQTGFAGVVLHLVRKFDFDLVFDDTDPEIPSEFPDTTPGTFRPRMRAGLQNLFSSFVRQTDDVFIEKLPPDSFAGTFVTETNSTLITITLTNRDHETERGRIVYVNLPSALNMRDGFYYVLETPGPRELIVDYGVQPPIVNGSGVTIFVPSRLIDTGVDLPTTDPLELKLETGFVNVFLSYPIDSTNLDIEVRKYDENLGLVWESNVTSSIKTNIKFREDPTGAVLAYFDNGTSFKVTKLNQDTGVFEWERDLNITGVLGNSVSNLYVILGFIMVFTFHVSGDFIVSKLNEEGDIVSQRATNVTNITVSDIIDYPVIIANDPWERINYLYYTTNPAISDVQISPTEYLHLGTFEVTPTFPGPSPVSELSEYQSLRIGSEDWYVYSDDVSGLRLYKNNTVIYNVPAGTKPRTPALGYLDGKVYLVYISYRIGFTEIVNMYTVEIDSLNTSNQTVYLRSFPDPEPDNFLPRVRASDTLLHRAYVRFNGKIYLDSFIPSEGRVTYPANTEIVLPSVEDLSLNCLDNRVFLAHPSGSDVALRRYTESYDENEDSYLMVSDYEVSFNGGDAIDSKGGIVLRFDSGRLYSSYTSRASETGRLTRLDPETGSETWSSQFTGIGGYLGENHTHGFFLFQGFPLVFSVKTTGQITASKFNDVTGLEVSTLTRTLTNFNPGTAIGSPVVLTEFPWEELYVISKASGLIRYEKQEQPREYVIPPSSDTIRKYHAVTELFEGKTTAVRHDGGGVTCRFTYYRDDPLSVDFPPSQELVTDVSTVLSNVGFHPTVSKFDDRNLINTTYMESFRSFTEVQTLVVDSIEEETFNPIWKQEIVFPDNSTTFYPMIRSQETSVTVGYVRGDGLLNLRQYELLQGGFQRELVTSHLITNPEEIEVAGDDDYLIGHPIGDAIKIIRFTFENEVTQDVLGNDVVETGVLTESWNQSFTDGTSEPKLHVGITQSIPQHVFVSYTALDTSTSSYVCRLFRVERRTNEVLWSRQIIDDMGGPNRLNGLNFEGSFINSTLVDEDFDGNPVTIDLRTFNLSFDNVTLRQFDDSFDPSTPLYKGSPLVIYNQGDGWAVLVYVDLGGTFQIRKTAVLGGAYKITYDSVGKVINPVLELFDSNGVKTGEVNYEEWWRPFLTINPETRGDEVVLRNRNIRPGGFVYEEPSEGEGILRITTDDPNFYEKDDIINVINIKDSLDVSIASVSGVVQEIVSTTEFIIPYTRTDLTAGTTGTCDTFLDEQSGEDGLVTSYHYMGYIKSYKTYVGKVLSGTDLEYGKNGQWIKEHTGTIGVGKKTEWGMPSKTNMKTLFGLFDDDTDGTLSRDELERMIEEYGGFQLTEEVYDEIFEAMKPDSGGEVTFQNFERIILSNRFTAPLVRKNLNHAVKRLETNLLDGLKNGQEIEYHLQRPAPAIRSTVSFTTNPTSGQSERNGPYVEFFDDGLSKKREVTFLNDKKEGVEITYYPPSVGSEVVNKEVTYSGGREISRTEYYEEGSYKLIYEPFTSIEDYDIAYRFTSYFKPPTPSSPNTNVDAFLERRYTIDVNRLKQGDEILYYSPGVKKYEGSYIRGLKLGTWTYYNRDPNTVDYVEEWELDPSSLTGATKTVLVSTTQT